MFAGKASEAMELYSSIFPDFRVEKIERYEEANPNAAAYVKIAEVSFLGHDLIVIDSPVRHDFTFTPAISLFVDCHDESELEATFRALSEGGSVFMPLADYGFSKRFGWCQDRYGVSWQLNLP